MFWQIRQKKVQNAGEISSSALYNTTYIVFRYHSLNLIQHVQLYNFFLALILTVSRLRC